MTTKTQFAFIRIFLTACLLLASTALLAAIDTDGDGVVDAAPIPISVDSYYTCALDASGVHCWGDNGSGQTLVPALSNPTAVNTGGGHACAIDATGMHCWGDNSNGQTTIPALSNLIAVSTGARHTCALDATGVHCWGRNSDGQITVPALSNPTAVSAGNLHTCALDATGVHCWGNNDYGQTIVPALTNPTAVSAGVYYSCALDDSGVHCWGDNSSGQTLVPALSNPIMVSAGAQHTCAVDDASVHCWGRNDFGETTVPALINPTVVSAGYYHTCAVDDVGVHCWGNNDFGQTAVPAGLVPKALDNCPQESNADQVDGDGDNLGDACDPLPADGNVLNIVGNSVSVKAEKFGSVVAYVGDFNGDHFGDWAVGMPRYTIPANGSTKAVKGAGQVKIISGNNGDVLAHVEGNVAGDGFGAALAGNADIDGDGLMDVVAGTPLADNTTALPKPIKDAGSVTVIYGCKGVACATAISSPKYGSTAKTGFGSAVALGDVDNDGKADVVVGEPKATNGQGEKPLKQAGKVTVLSATDITGFPLLEVYGATTNAHAGAAVAVGDVDHLFGEEVIVGAPDDDDVEGKRTDAGSVKIYTRNFAFVDESDAYYGRAAKDHFGTALAAGADVDGDGVDDVLVGVPGLDDSTNAKNKDVGGVVALYGIDNTDMWLMFGGSLHNFPLFFDAVLGSEPKLGLGSSVALGDVNGDGYADAILSAPKGDDTTQIKVVKDAGSVMVFSGNDFVQLSGTQYGVSRGDAFGSSISAGDVNADGKADIIVGIPSKDITVNIDGKDKVQKDTGGVAILNATLF